MVITKTRFFGYRLGSGGLNAGFSMHYGRQSMQFGHPPASNSSAPRLEFDSPRVCPCNKKAGRHVCLPARSLWWRRGESCVFAAAGWHPPCVLRWQRRSRALLSSAPRLEFDSPRVRSCNKKAGRHLCLPARSLWWRRGESNSGPRKPPDRHLQAQSLI